MECSLIEDRSGDAGARRLPTQSPLEVGFEAPADVGAGFESELDEPVLEPDTASAFEALLDSPVDSFFEEESFEEESFEEDSAPSPSLLLVECFPEPRLSVL